MSSLQFTLRSAPSQRLDLGKLTPGALAMLSVPEIERIVISGGPQPLCVADVFMVSGTPGDTVAFAGGSDRFDFVGAGNTGGAVIVEGDVGAYAAAKMESGRLDVRGNAGPFLASTLLGGMVRVSGSAGDNLGAPRRGERDGMSGGTVVVSRGIGEYAGARMRRGTIITPGKVAAYAGERMMGGTILAEAGFGEAPGVQMRRGTLIAPGVERLLPTFVDCGVHDLVILRILNRHLRRTLGDLAPAPLPLKVQRIAGDMASIGRGEILLTR